MSTLPPSSGPPADPPTIPPIEPTARAAPVPLLVRPNSPNVLRPFAEYWPEARAQRQTFLRQFQTIWNRLKSECESILDLEGHLRGVWTWKWLFNLFHSCEVHSLEDLRAILRASREVDRCLEGVKTLPQLAAFIEYKSSCQMPGRALCHITESERDRARRCGELASDPDPYLWLDRLLDSKPLSEEESLRINRTGYVISGHDADDESWLGKGFGKYQDHVSRAIRDGMKILALEHNRPLPTDLDGMDYGRLLNEATTWLSAVPPPPPTRTSQTLAIPVNTPRHPPTVVPILTSKTVRPGPLDATTSDSDACEAVASPPPDDFIARRNRERDEWRRQNEAEKQELETIFLAPMRQLRPEWDAAWKTLWASLSPVWRPWQEPGKPDGEPDVPAVVGALKQVSAAILRHDELSRHIGASKLVPPAMPHTLAERLARVESRDSDFVNLTPVCSAVALVLFALKAYPEGIAERVRMVLEDDDARPAFGWLLYIRDCLWPAKQFMEPAEVVENINWPVHRRVRCDDMQRLKYLLRPEDWPNGTELRHSEISYGNASRTVPAWDDPKFTQPVEVASISTPSTQIINLPTAPAGASIVPLRSIANDLPPIDDAALAVLETLNKARPKLLKNVEIEAAIKRSKQAIGEAVRYLLDKNLVSRPNGERKGVTITPSGIELLERIHSSSTVHP